MFQIKRYEIKQNTYNDSSYKEMKEKEINICNKLKEIEKQKAIVT